MASVTPRTEKARIQAMAAEIRAARAKGIRWADICHALGVPRSTLLSALKGVEAAPQPRATKKGANEIPGSTSDQPATKSSKVRKWGASD